MRRWQQPICGALETCPISKPKGGGRRGPSAESRRREQAALAVAAAAVTAENHSLPGRAPSTRLMPSDAGQSSAASQGVTRVLVGQKVTLMPPSPLVQCSPTAREWHFMTSRHAWQLPTGRQSVIRLKSLMCAASEREARIPH